MAGSVAEHLRLPFISLAFFPPLIRDDRIPPFCFGWHAGHDPISRLRNRLGMRLLTRVAAPIYAVVNQQRAAWGLQALKRRHRSPLTSRPDRPAPRSPRIRRPRRSAALLHYTGPFVDSQQRPPIDFPWDRLDGAHSSTPLSARSRTSPTLSSGPSPKPCAGLNAQLVLSLGGGLDPSRLGPFPAIPSSCAMLRSWSSSSAPPPSSPTPDSTPCSNPSPKASPSSPSHSATTSPELPRVSPLEVQASSFPAQS